MLRQLADDTKLHASQLALISQRVSFRESRLHCREFGPQISLHYDKIFCFLSIPLDTLLNQIHLCTLRLNFTRQGFPLDQSSCSEFENSRMLRFKQSVFPTQRLELRLSNQYAASSPFVETQERRPVSLVKAASSQLEQATSAACLQAHARMPSQLSDSVTQHQSTAQSPGV